MAPQATDVVFLAPVLDGLHETLDCLFVDAHVAALGVARQHQAAHGDLVEPLPQAARREGGVLDILKMCGGSRAPPTGTHQLLIAKCGHGDLISDVSSAATSAASESASRGKRGPRQRFRRPFDRQ